MSLGIPSEDLSAYIAIKNGMGVLRKPVDYKEWKESLMTNLDYEINEEVAQKLREEKYYAAYTAWDFIGYVWWDNDLNKWHCEVWKVANYQDTKTANSLEELMAEISSEYGEK